MKFIVTLSLVFGFSSLSLGQTAAIGSNCTSLSQAGNDPHHAGQAGVVSCQGRSCYYIPKRANASVLAQSLRMATEGSSASKWAFDQGYSLQGRLPEEVQFWHVCEDTLSELKRLVQALDVTAVSHGRRRVVITVKIYQLTRGTFANLALGVAGVLDGAVGETPARGSLGGSSEGLNLAFGNLTNRLLGIKLAGSKESSNAFEVRDFDFPVYEGDEISRSEDNTRLVDVGIGQASTKDLGYRIYGQVSIDGDSKENQNVVIRGLSIRLGNPSVDPKQFGTVKQFENPQLIIPKGRPILVGAESIGASEIGGETGLMFLNKSNIRRDSKLVVFIQAKIDENSDDSVESYNRLSAEEIKTLAPNPGVDLLKGAQFNVLSASGDNGFDLVTMKLPLEGLSQKNYQDLIQVKLEANGERFTEKYMAEELVSGFLQIPTSYSLNRNGEAKIKIEMEWFTGSDKVLAGFKKKIRYEVLHLARPNIVQILKVN